MGYCFSTQDSEVYIYDLLSSPAFYNLEKDDIDRILVTQLKGEPDYNNRANLKIKQDDFNNIANDIIETKYQQYRKVSVELKGKEFKDKDAVQEFTKGLYKFIDINNNVNSLIFKLIMIPFILREKGKVSDKIREEHFYKNVDTFYEYIEKVSFSDKNMSLIKHEMNYEQFSETFLLYLAIVLSGWTKLIMESSTIDKESDLYKDFEESLNFYFTPENIKKYYSNLTKDLIRDLQSKPEYVELNSSIVEKEDFKIFCEDNEFILDYFELRKNFREFIEKENTSKIVK